MARLIRKESGGQQSIQLLIGRDEAASLFAPLPSSDEHDKLDQVALLVGGEDVMALGDGDIDKQRSVGMSAG